MLPDFRKDAALWVRVIRRLMSLYRNTEKNLRIFWWNQQPGFSVSKHIQVCRNIKLEAEPFGIMDGGIIKISDGARIGDGVIFVPSKGSIVLHENVFLGPYSVIYGTGGVTIGKNTMIAGHSVIVANNHVFEDDVTPIFHQPITARGIVIGEDVWIGCGVRVLDGVTIGNGCVVGAGAVVNKSLPDYSIAVGVPAKVVGTRGN